MRILVTGGSGFLGGHITRYLIDRGYDVAAVVRDKARAGRIPAAAKILIHDGKTQGLIDLTGDFGPDVVVHLASKYIAAHVSGDVEPLISSNVLLGAQLLEAMAAAGVRRLLNFGTSFQHFGGDEYHPVSLYSATKQAFEVLAQYYVEAHGLAMMTLKLSDTYGPEDERGKIIALLDKISRTGERLALSPGGQAVNFVHSDDVARAVGVALDRLVAGDDSRMEAFAIRGAELLTLREFVELFGEITGRTLNVDWGARPYRDREVMDPWLGPLLPGWAQRISLRDGLGRLTHV